MLNASRWTGRRLYNNTLTQYYETYMVTPKRYDDRYAHSITAPRDLFGKEINPLHTVALKTFLLYEK